MADPPTAVEVMQHQGRAAERTLASSRQHTRVGFRRTKLLDKQASRGRRSRGSSRGNRQCPSPLVSNCAHASVAALVICLSARCAITEAAARVSQYPARVLAAWPIVGRCIPPLYPDGQWWGTFLTSAGFGGSLAVVAALTAARLAWLTAQADRRERRLAVDRSQWWERFSGACEKAVSTKPGE